MRCLDSYGVVEKGVDGYTAATVAKTFAEPQWEAALEVAYVKWFRMLFQVETC